MSQLTSYFENRKTANMILDTSYGSPRIGMFFFCPINFKNTNILPYRNVGKGVFLFNEEHGERPSDSLLFGCCKSKNGFDPSSLDVQMKIESERVFKDLMVFSGMNGPLGLYLIDDDFFERLSSFEETNKKRYNKAIADDNLEAHKLSFFLSDGSTQIYDWCYKHLNSNIDYFYNLLLILRMREKYKTKQCQLSKGSITSYYGDKELDQLLMEYRDIRINANTVKAISFFNTKQRKQLKEADMSGALGKREKNLLNLVKKLPAEKRSNLVKKVSPIEDLEKLFETISISVGANFGWSRKSLIAHLKNSPVELDFEIVYDKDNIIVLKIYDFETASYIGKATNWCITRDKEYWDNYNAVDQAEQYIILNFNLPENSEYSIVGVTQFKKTAIYAAHSFTNKNLLFDASPFKIIPSLQTISEYLTSIGVMDTLLKGSIVLSLESREDVETFIRKNISDDYELKECDGDKFAVISFDKRFGEFIDDNFFNTDAPIALSAPRNYICGKEYDLYVFLFDLTNNDVSKRINAIEVIGGGFRNLFGIDGIMQTIKKEKIEHLLREYDINLSYYIPYKYDKYNRFMNAMHLSDVQYMLDAFLNDSDIRERLKTNYSFALNFCANIETMMSDILKNTVIVSELSEDNIPLIMFIKGIHSHGYKLIEEIPRFYSQIIRTLLERFNMMNLCGNYGNLYDRMIDVVIRDEVKGVSKLEDLINEYI